MEARDRYLSWLTSEITAQTNYHNHKETMAWVATALYITGVIVLARVVADGFLTNWPDWLIFLIFLIFLLALGIVLIFIWKQFDLRGTTADTVHALMHLTEELCNDTVNIAALNHTLVPDDLWVQFIRERIEAVGGKGRSTITKLATDGVSYLAVITATVIAIHIAVF